MTQADTHYEMLRTKHLETCGPVLAEGLARLEWSPERLHAHRTEALRETVAHAKRHSPWHRERLRDVDPAELELDMLGELPVMTKDDLMGHWDEIVTDDRLGLERAERHLAALDAPRYLLDEFHVVASGGTGGTRGVFVYGWDEWATYYMAGFRWVFRWMVQRASADERQLVGASIGATSPRHATVASTTTFGTMPTHRFGVDRPLDETVPRLQEVQPTMLLGFPSMLHRLSACQVDGTLDIDPALVVTTAEPLLPETAEQISAAWGAPIINLCGTCDVGPVACGCGLGTGMHRNDDLVIAELRDGDERAVPPGSESHDVIYTSLYHRTLPMIRYRLDDRVRVHEAPCDCGVHYPLVDVSGRADDTFRFGDVVVHPHLFRDVLGRRRAITEYQVRQTQTGVHVLLVTTGDVDTRALSSELAAALTELGLRDPAVETQVVADIPRVGIGKLPRFVPLR